MCSVVLASITDAGFIVNPRSHITDTIPFDSDASSAEAYISASALLLAMICCLRVYVFYKCLPSNTTPALEDYRVSVQPPQSESEYGVTSVLI